MKLIKSRVLQPCPTYVVIHWDDKLLLNVHIKHITCERVPIVVIKNVIKKNIESEEQVMAICNALERWGLSDIIQAICCDTTAFNINQMNII